MLLPLGHVAGADQQVVRIGLFENRPMCYSEAGRPAGLFVVVLDYIASQEGWQLDYVEGTWVELLDKLAAGEIDILPSMALSATRQDKYAFNTRDVFTNWGEIYTRTGSKIHTFFDLQGKRVATVDQAIYTMGPEGITSLVAVYGIKSDFRLVDNYRQALAMVAQGQADVAVVNRLVGALYGSEYGLQKSGIVFSPVKIRYGLTKDGARTPALIAAIDRHLAELQEDLGSPYHQYLDQILTKAATPFHIPQWFMYLLAGVLALMVVLLLFVYVLRRQVAMRTRELQSSERRFQDFADNCLDWIWEFDENTLFTYASPRVQDLLGYSPEEVLGKSAFDLIPSPEKEKVAEEFFAMQDKRQSFALLENVNQHKDGHLVTLESSGVPIFDEAGNFKGYRGIDRDISERKAIEGKLQQAQKMEAIGTLAGGIAHDFNNILSAIFGYAELAKLQLQEHQGVESLEEDIEQILHGARRARELVSQILTFSRQSKQEKQVVELAVLVKEALKLLRPSIPTTIAIEQKINSAARIYADISQIHQLIMNLCTNAYHAMEETGGTLTIRLTEKNLASPRSFCGDLLPVGRYVVMEVCDTGKGIAREYLDKIFEPYFTTKDTGRGTGLGLAVVHGVVDSHHGAIDVASMPGQGACFAVYLPVFGDGLRQEREQAEHEDIAAGRGERILVVDDETGVRQVIGKMLATAGYRVDLCASGQEALDNLAIHQGGYDLLITDMTMPGMTGKELARQVMLLYPHLPIVLCTGYSSQLNAREAEALGLAAYLTKPLARVELLDQVRQILAGGSTRGGAVG